MAAAAEAAEAAAAAPRDAVPPAVRELSGVLTSEERWDQTWEALAAPGCQIAALRVMHNTDEQAAATARAIARCPGCGVLESLEVGLLGEGAAEALAEVLQGSSSLRVLKLHRIASEAAAAALAPGLRRAAALRTLCIGAAGPAGGAAACGAAAAEHIGSALAAGGAGAGGALRLTRMELRGLEVGAAAAAALCRGLAAQECLEYLEVINPKVDTGSPNSNKQARAAGPGAAQGEGAEEAAEQLPALAVLLGAELRGHMSLREVTVSGAALPPAAAAAVGSLIARDAAAPCGDSGGGGGGCVEALRLSDCALGDDGAAALANALAPAGRVAKPPSPLSLPPPPLVPFSLSLERCGLGPAGAAAVGSAARACPSLAALSLLGDEIGPGGAEALAVSLDGHTGLRHLTISGAGVEAVPEPLCALLSRPSCRLKALALPCNRIPDAGASALAAALHLNASVARLDLSSNWIGDAGGLELASVLRAHPAMRCLNLDGNRLRTVAVEALHDAALSNPRVLELGASTSRAVSALAKTCAGDVQRALRQRRAREAARAGEAAPSGPGGGDGGGGALRAAAAAAGGGGAAAAEPRGPPSAPHSPRPSDGEARAPKVPRRSSDASAAPAGSVWLFTDGGCSGAAASAAAPLQLPGSCSPRLPSPFGRAGVSDSVGIWACFSAWDARGEGQDLEAEGGDDTPGPREGARDDAGGTPAASGTGGGFAAPPAPHWGRVGAGAAAAHGGAPLAALLLGLDGGGRSVSLEGWNQLPSPAECCAGGACGGHGGDAGSGLFEVASLSGWVAAGGGGGGAGAWPLLLGAGGSGSGASSPRSPPAAAARALLGRCAGGRDTGVGGWAGGGGLMVRTRSGGVAVVRSGSGRTPRRGGADLGPPSPSCGASAGALDPAAAAVTPTGKLQAQQRAAAAARGGRPSSRLGAVRGVGVGVGVGGDGGCVGGGGGVLEGCGFGAMDDEEEGVTLEATAW